jgi:hypothetical protein
LVLKLLSAGQHLGLLVILQSGHDIGVDAVADDLQRQDSDGGSKVEVRERRWYSNLKFIFY